jgi:RNA polymerase sigma-70 factor, ECF subfamily
MDSMVPDSGPTTESDADLLSQITGGRAEALSLLYDRHGPALFALALRILRNAQDAEEVLQEAFIHVWNRAASYDAERSSVSTWLVLVTRSRAIDRLRSRRVREKTVLGAQQEELQPHTSPEGARNVLTHERRMRVRREVTRLPSEQQQVLELAFYRGLTQSEIAATTGIPLGTVKTRTLLAMKKLRKALRNDIRDLL